MRALAICLFLILLVCLTANTNAQAHYRQKLFYINSIVFVNSDSLNAATSGTRRTLKQPFVTALTSVKTLPTNYAYNQLGFFCRQEIKFEKGTSLPFKFRLGSVQYCDVLEGKLR